MHAAIASSLNDHPKCLLFARQKEGSLKGVCVRLIDEKISVEIQ